MVALFHRRMPINKKTIDDQTIFELSSSNQVWYTTDDLFLHRSIKIIIRLVRGPPWAYLLMKVRVFIESTSFVSGAVGGLAHHPLVGMTVGEASGVVALRRGLVGALAKPLSATADLVAFAGQGLLSQTGWDPDPQVGLPPRPLATTRYVPVPQLDATTVYIGSRLSRSD